MVTPSMNSSSPKWTVRVLTEKGLATGKLIADKIDCVLEEVSVGLTEEERLSFYRSLTIISESLDAVAKSSGKQSAE